MRVPLSGASVRLADCGAFWRMHECVVGSSSSSLPAAVLEGAQWACTCLSCLQQHMEEGEAAGDVTVVLLKPPLLLLLGNAAAAGIWGCCCCCQA